MRQLRSMGKESRMPSTELLFEKISHTFGIQTLLSFSKLYPFVHKMYIYKSRSVLQTPSFKAVLRIIEQEQNTEKYITLKNSTMQDCYGKWSIRLHENSPDI